MSNRYEVGRATEVMVRSYRYEPVRLWALNIGGEAVEVASEDRTATISFPAGDVFAFEPDLFRRLQTAYEKNQTAQLKSLWSSAKHIQS